MNYAQSNANLRQHQRQEVGLSAAVKYGDHNDPCRIMDISVGGSKIEVKGSLQKGDDVCLNIGGMEDVPGNVVWKNRSTYGLKFTGDPDRVAETIMVLAAYA